MSRAITLDVHLALIGPASEPLAGIAARVVFGADRALPDPTAGTRLVTDAAGGARFTTSLHLERRWRKLPTNFVTSLASLPRRTEFLRVGAELPFLGSRWLYTADLYRFAGGNPIALGDTSVFTPDAAGHFTRQAERDGHQWTMPGVDGMALSHPGWEITDWSLHPMDDDPAAGRWTLSLGYRRAAEPARR